MQKSIVTALVILFSSLLLNKAYAESSFNILVYHHVATDTPASTSVSPEQFRQHLELIKSNGYQVVDLAQALDTIRSGEPLAKPSIAITFDDGFNDIYTQAWPLLKEYNFPFTVFVSTDAIDQQLNGMLSWDQIRDLHKHGVTIANHTTDHDYLVRYENYDQAWLESISEKITTAQQRLETELDSELPKWLAYPYGEFNQPLQHLLKQLGYLGFAQHSGGVWQGSDFLAIPRFAAAGIYANPNTLKVKLASKPMPIDNSLLSDMVTDQSQPTLKATLLMPVDMSRSLNCFVNGRAHTAQWISDLEFTLTSDTALEKGRHRYNCTSRSSTGNFYYWFSKPWLVLPKEG
ncbi:polysaccharide deacetylase family protein [Reinekea thalattae]|uniref:Polysaccharide deacetylase family protein n=1 Tax=Reinekea thalattae TaxID=2593301 RepID=A0A5C8Z973_9GAMM|nr:polysaccharide deacetylase family protein [Reinekea thalattae]TXR53924.1 polysaccharide deacetylase family protein [Reinekea thalattae]